MDNQKRYKMECNEPTISVDKEIECDEVWKVGWRIFRYTDSTFGVVFNPDRPCEKLIN